MVTRTNVSHGKTIKRWCDSCGTLILGTKCSICHSVPKEFEINSPGDIRPCMDAGYSTLVCLFQKNFGSSSIIDRRMVFFNKIPGEDRTDEVIANGNVISVLRYDVKQNELVMELKQAGAELLSEEAKKNIITLGNVTGHLKGKNISGSEISSVTGDFEKGDPLIIKKGGKTGHGIALVNSNDIKTSEKAVKIRDISVPSGIILSPTSGRDTFVNANVSYLKEIESSAANEIRSYVKQRREKVTVSFSGGKDSLAALGVTLKAVNDAELIFVNTGIEFPETVSYVKKAAKTFGLRLHEASAGNSFWNNVDIFGPPAKDFRWCCKVCKLGPVTELISERFPKGTITIEGNRALESFARSNIGFVSKNPFVPNQISLDPIRKWTASDVWGYIWWKRYIYNPLYENDMERIGCYLCASCLSSEWNTTKRTHPEMYGKWDTYLKKYAKERGLTEEYVNMGFWRWKILPPKMIKLAEEMKMAVKPKAKGEMSVKMLKGASPCAAGGYSMEAIVTIPRSRPFSATEDALRTIGDVRYSDEFETALLRTKKGTAKLFGGGQVSVVSENAKDAEHLFERSVKALLRSQLCTLCGICAKKCQHNAIKIDKGLKVNADKCNSCGKCESSCMVIHYYDKMMQLGNHY
ncbi:MAG: phosphoadenosine phosphosulfate reductase family protein [Methanomassiliicoccaceae archaeon]|nr:phosphoadenosine phosphosulfate reductase family protein [Methanomassiliicoccaceae archaeon]